MAAGVGDVAVEVAADGDLARGRRREPDHHPHRGRLAGAVGPEEAGHPAGAARRSETSSTAVKPPYVLVSPFTLIMRPTLPADTARRASAAGLDRAPTKVGGVPARGRPGPVIARTSLDRDRRRRTETRPRADAGAGTPGGCACLRADQRAGLVAGGRASEWTDHRTLFWLEIAPRDRAPSSWWSSAAGRRSLIAVVDRLPERVLGHRGRAGHARRPCRWRRCGGRWPIVLLGRAQRRLRR